MRLFVIHMSFAWLFWSEAQSSTAQPTIVCGRHRLRLILELPQGGQTCVTIDIALEHAEMCFDCAGW